MNRNFKAVVITHKNAPVQIREQVALSDSEAELLLRQLRSLTDATDLMILSTCNRTEIYYSSEHLSSDECLKILCLFKEIRDISSIEAFTTFIEETDHAVRHLYRVSVGLESNVIGDLQIPNQVKKAYQRSADEQVAGPFLHRLMHSIFFTNKKVVQETAFRDGAASVSYVAADLAADYADQIHDARILVVGLGKIGSDVARNLKETSVGNVTLMNRSFDKAVELGRELNFPVRDLGELREAIDHADIIISSVSGKSPLMTKQMVSSMTFEHKTFFDLSVPRSISAGVDAIPGTLVFNVDEIHAKADKAKERRVKSIPYVEELVEEALQEFKDWNKEMMVSPTINKLKGALEEIRKNEMARYLRNSTEEEVELINKVTKSMMQQVIKLPTLQLKAACKRGEAETLIDILNDLFDLEKKDQKVEG